MVQAVHADVQCFHAGIPDISPVAWAASKLFFIAKKRESLKGVGLKGVCA